jgi:hypothetical protein
VEHAGTFAVCLLLCPAVFMHRRRLEYCAQQKFGGFVFCLFYIVLQSILNFFLLLI